MCEVFLYFIIHIYFLLLSCFGPFPSPLTSWPTTTHTHMYTHTPTYLTLHTHTQTHTRVHTQTHTPRKTRAIQTLPPHSHADTVKHTHTYTHTHTHTHTLAYEPPSTQAGTGKIIESLSSNSLYIKYPLREIKGRLSERHRR